MSSRLQIACNFMECASTMQMCPACSVDNADHARFCVRCGQPLRQLLGYGTVLMGRYQVVRVLGCGGMGAVYLAFDKHLDNAPVAIKENLDESPEAQRQFINEARILSRLHHPHLPRVRDFFVGPTGRQYMVMDYIGGDDLFTIVQRNGPLPTQQALLWMNEIMDAVEYLHNQNPPIIHRDIKPANIKLTPAGTPMLVDFGIAKVYQPGHHTALGARAVSPGFSPLEQYGQGTTDQRSDVYSLGATLYYLLTGRVPPEAIERAAGATDRLIPVRSINPNVSAHVDKAIWMALRVHPNERLQSVRDFRLALSGKLPLRISPPRATHPVPTAPSVGASDLSSGEAHPGSVPSHAPGAEPNAAEAPAEMDIPMALAATIATPAQRFMAAFIDVVVLIPVLFIIGIGTWGLGSIVMSIMAGPTNWVVDESRFYNFQQTLFIIGPILYRFLCHWWWGQTLGKAIFNLKIVTRDGRQPNILRILIREFAFFVLMPLCCWIGLLPIMFVPSRQGFHDALVDTYVIKMPVEQNGAMTF